MPATRERIEMIALDQIRRDGGTQMRTEMRQDVIDDYAENLDQLPPADVFVDDDGQHWLADGFYRFMAHEREEHRAMPCRVRSGTLRDAILFSISSNLKHGLRPSADDKRAAVRKLLEDDEWSKWSDLEIARRCGASHWLVAQLRESRISKNLEIDTGTEQETGFGSRLVSRGGKTYPMKTKRIGRKPQREKKQPEQKTKPSPEVPQETDRSDPEPWKSYNAKVERAVELLAEARDAILSVEHDVYGGWMKTKDWQKFFAGTIDQFRAYAVAGWGSTQQQANLRRPFVYAHELRSARKKR